MSGQDIGQNRSSNPEQPHEPARPLYCYPVLEFLVDKAAHVASTIGQTFHAVRSKVEPIFVIDIQAESNKGPVDRFPALTRLVESVDEVFGATVRHHEQSTPALEAGIAWLDKHSKQMLGWKAFVLVTRESETGKFWLDVTGRGVIDAEPELEVLCRHADAVILSKQPDFDWEFTVNGKRSAPLAIHHPDSKVLMHCNEPHPDLEDIAFSVQAAIETRFGRPPHIAVYRTHDEPPRYALHVAPPRDVDSLAVTGRLRSLDDYLRAHKFYRFVEYEIYLDGRPLTEGRVLARPEPPAIRLEDHQFSPDGRNL